MRFKIVTLGCKVNIYESEVINELLLKEGFLNDEDNPDIIIINTCSVTNMADAKSRKLIRSEKRSNPNSLMVVCGCSAENQKDKLEDLGIDILIGNRNKSKIVSLIKEYLKSHIKYADFAPLTNDFEDMEVDKFTTHTRAFLKIQDGCNNYCTYCIIPYLRGPLRSKPIDKAVEECQNLVKSGHKEIVLTGIHTGRYGRELGYDLTTLLKELIKIPSLDRIRISSIEATEITDEFLELLKTSSKICNHLHIPLQCGSDKILKLMNRKYTKEEFLNIIKKIRDVRSDIAISTDVIVGFPSETEEDFKESYDFCKKIEFSKIHVFPYSKRDGTVAAKMKDQVEKSIKHERSKELNALSLELEERYAKKFIGKEVEVLIEEEKDGYFMGHTSNYLKVMIKGDLKINELVKVKIVSVKANLIIGNVIYSLV